MARFRSPAFKPNDAFHACRAVSLGMAEAGGRAKISPPGPITITDVTRAPRITGQALPGPTPWCGSVLRAGGAPVHADPSSPANSNGTPIRATSRRMPVRRSDLPVGSVPFPRAPVEALLPGTQAPALLASP